MLATLLCQFLRIIGVLEMKNKIILSLLGFLMIAGGFDEGCEEEEPKPDYINVYLGAEGFLRTKNLNIGGWICNDITQNKPVKIDFYKKIIESDGKTTSQTKNEILINGVIRKEYTFSKNYYFAIYATIHQPSY